MTAPSPVDYKAIKTGDTRGQIHSRLGLPKTTAKKLENDIEYYEFTDGYNYYTKARILIYLAGDVFTAGLSEIIFYPLEEGLLQGQECLGEITFDPADRVVDYLVTKEKSGEVLWSPKMPTETRKTAAKSSP
ncbi:MAG: hypothetical protein ACRER2_04095 [Methylococcales bacterium]